MFFDDLEWDISHEPAIPGRQTPVTLDITADFDDKSRTLEGDNLWQVSLFGSTRSTGKCNLRNKMSNVAFIFRS